MMYSASPSVTFCNKIEHIVQEEFCSYLEALVRVMNESDVKDEKEVSKLLSPSIKSQIHKEAQDLNMFRKKKVKTLPQ